MNDWFQRATNYRPGLLGKNAILGTVGLGARAAIQIVYLLLVSRWLGAAGYGLFAGSVALVSLAGPLANWGSRYLIPKHIAKSHEHARAIWATALIQTCAMGSLLIIATLAMATAVLPEHLPLWPLTLLAVSELIFLPASQAASSQCLALERGSWAALSVSLVPAARTTLMLLTVASGVSAEPTTAALAHFAGSLIGIAGAYILVNHVNGGPPQWSHRLTLRDATKQGTSYALSNAAVNSYQEIDKVLMLQLLGAAIVGPYTVAFRVAAVFALPINALISATLPRLLTQHEQPQMAATYKAMLRMGLAYGALAAIVMLVTAPAVPLVFGNDYAQASNYIAIMSPWPLLFALRNCIATKLTATNRQRSRTAVEIFGLVLVASLNLLMLSRYGAIAAIWSLLITELTMTFCMAACLRKAKIN